MMVLPWRRRRSTGKKELLSNLSSHMEITIPSQFQCPISLDLMKDPVIVSTGITYDRESIEKWIEAGNQTCPVTNQVLKTIEQIPNHAIRRMIQDWCVEKGSYGGIERIPTPRVPVGSHEVCDICTKIANATRRGDNKKCGELVAKIKRLGKESERNKRCVRENGAGLVLSSCFEAFGDDVERNVFLLEETLSVLTWMLPLGAEGQAKLCSMVSLRCMVRFLQSGDDSVRQNAAFLIKELLSLDQKHVLALMEVDGVVEAMVKLIKDSVCSGSIKSCLSALFHMISSSTSNKKVITRFLEMGLVSLIVEMIVDGEKSVCEKALTVLEAICESEEGREEMIQNALIMPLLVKKILRVSDLATKSSVSIIWKLCKINDENVVEALLVGAFQKLLVVLQVGCGEGTKEKVTELLKMMNVLRGKIGNDCVDSTMDFKYLKRPF